MTSVIGVNGNFRISEKIFFRRGSLIENAVRFR